MLNEKELDAIRRRVQELEEEISAMNKVQNKSLVDIAALVLIGKNLRELKVVLGMTDATSTQS